MSKEKQDVISRVNLSHLGLVYRLIEQFELISRIDLSKISGLAPASITNLTRELINSHLVIEKSVQNTIVRGRPAVGLCLSPHYWRYLAITLNKNTLDVSLCALNGQIIQQLTLPLDQIKSSLTEFIVDSIYSFVTPHSMIPDGNKTSIIACSLCLLGKYDSQQRKLYLGDEEINEQFAEDLQSHFDFPIVVSEHFSLWTFAETHLGRAINSNNVIFLQFDDAINISVLSEGKMLRNAKQKRMNIDRVALPKISELSDKIAQDVPEIERHYLYNQVSNKAIYQLIDLLLPNNLNNDENKIHYLCDLANQNNPHAIKIIYHLADSVSYLLMYLTNLFASEKIMINTRLLAVKDIFLHRLADKLQDALLSDEHQVEIITSKYHWNDPVIASSAIKQQLYDGELITRAMKLSE